MIRKKRKIALKIKIKSFSTAKYLDEEELPHIANSDDIRRSYGNINNNVFNIN